MEEAEHGVFGLDVHKRYTVFTHVDERGKGAPPRPRRNDAESLSELTTGSKEPLSSLWLLGQSEARSAMRTMRCTTSASRLWCSSRSVFHIQGASQIIGSDSPGVAVSTSIRNTLKA
jgi:hypothetical protein